MWIFLGGSQERFWTGPRPEVRELVLLFCTRPGIVKPGFPLLLAATRQPLPRLHAGSMTRRATWQRAPPSLEERALTADRFLSTGHRHYGQGGIRPATEAPERRAVMAIADSAVFDSAQEFGTARSEQPADAQPQHASYAMPE
ncbi:hypothetical protein HMPREF9612_01469 [Cutibacterium acnes HL063PA2]|nr:hypothetical protein HMPREF9612_01469 [Cutibacterium acnes HL063PA2]